MNKRGMSWEMLIGIIVLAVTIAILLIFLWRADFKNIPNSQICHDSVVLKTTGGGYVGGLNCKTDYVCISGGGKCTNMNPTITINVDPTNKTQIMKAVSDQLAQCWWTFGEGKLDYQGVYAHIFAGLGSSPVCGVCSIVGFDSTIQSQLSPGSVLSDSSKFTSVEAWSDNYAQFSSLFDKYSKEDVPEGISQNYFKALLVAIAQENNWGSDSDGSWLMGYKSGDGSYRDPEKQISTVAKILKTAFETPSVQIEDQTGTVSKDYASCKKNSNFEKQATCILSVYKTGRAPAGGFLKWLNDKLHYQDTLLNGIFHPNFKGSQYASNVLFYWNVLQEYFNQQATQTLTGSTVKAALTYQDLFYYMTTHSVVEDQQKQPYLTFLYGVSSLAEFVQGGSRISQLYNSGSIPLNGQYAIVTAEGKNIKLLKDVFVFTIISPNAVPDFVPPLFVPTEKVSDYFGPVCGNNFITSA